MEFLINDTFFSFSSFNNALIYGREDFFILAVLYFFVLNFFCLLIFIFRAYSLLEKDASFCHFSNSFLANLRHKFVLLVSNDCMFKVLNPSLYERNLVPIIILTATFCTLSKSFLFFSVRLLCHTTADCSNTLLINVK